MARTYAQIKVSMWSHDDDFRALSVNAQHLYLVLLTHPGLNLAGVVDWRPRRLASLANGWSDREVRKAATELVAGNYLVIDEDTEEALIRSFIKNDGVLKNPKVAAGMVTAWSEVYSIKLRRCIAEQAMRALPDAPSDALSRAVRQLMDYQSDTQSDTQSEGVSDQVADSPSTFYLLPSTSNLHTLTPDHPSMAGQNATPLATKKPKPKRFDEWWSKYPRKAAKADGEKAYRKAVEKGVPEQLLIDKADTFAQATTNTEKRFIPYPSTWLNQGRWDDDMSAYENSAPAPIADRRPNGEGEAWMRG